MKKWKITGNFCMGRWGWKRRYGNRAAGFLVLSLLAASLAGCQAAAADDHSAAAEQGAEREAVLEQSREEDNTEAAQRQEQQSDAGKSGSSTEGPVIEEGKITVGDTMISLEQEDEYTAWDENSSVMIGLDDSGITITGEGAISQGTAVTIEKSGTYVLSGSLSDGTILVDAGDDDIVRLVFSGVDIHSETSAPVDIKKAGKTIISLEEGTVNSLSDSPDFTYRDQEKEEPNGALFSKSDLTINGSGTLKVDGTFNNGICSKDILKIAGGVFEISAANHGIKGNDALVIYNGQFTIAAGGDGVKSDILAVILDGDVLITGCEEGIEAETVVIHGGTVELTASDDGINASTDEDNTPQLYFMGGTVTVRADGDGIDSNGSIHMSGGQVTVYGPSSRDNGALDYDGEFQLTGGVLAAFGPGGMEQNVSSSDSQVSVLADFGETLKAGTEVILRDKDGKELYRGAGEKDFRTVVISTPEMKSGSEYELQAGEIVISFVPEENIISVNKDGVQEAGAMGPGRGGPEGRGGRMNGGREGGEEGGRPERPEGERPAPPERQTGERPAHPEDQAGERPASGEGQTGERPAPPEDHEGGRRQEPAGDGEGSKNTEQ